MLSFTISLSDFACRLSYFLVNVSQISLRKNSLFLVQFKMVHHGAERKEQNAIDHIAHALEKHKVRNAHFSLCTQSGIAAVG